MGLGASGAIYHWAPRSRNARSVRQILNNPLTLPSPPLERGGEGESRWKLTQGSATGPPSLRSTWAIDITPLQGCRILPLARVSLATLD